MLNGNGINYRHVYKKNARRINYGHFGALPFVY